ncbi:MAG TPA: hypothetical protein VGX23_05655 [Actinocrinis sp.]|nr:hypothetical protein [Actinocrinis sp.]
MTGAFARCPVHRARPLSPPQQHRAAAVAASADSVHRLVRGRLTESRGDSAVAAAQSAFVAVVLRPGPEAGPDSQKAAKALEDLPDVRTIRWTDSRVYLELDCDHSDAVLATALGDGYSVREVRLVDAPTPRPGDAPDAPGAANASTATGTAADPAESDRP